MVKPTLKPESEKEKKDDELKDDKLKEWGILPAAVVIDESEKEKDKKDAEAAIEEFEHLETDVDEGRPMLVKFCACFAVFTILLIVTCTIGSFLYFHYGNSEEHKWKGWCSVKYNDDESGEKGHHGHGGRHGDRDSSSSEEDRHPYGNDALHPRPTGPPGGRTCNQQSQVDLDNQLVQVERPQESDCERVTILHDYNVNISAYRLWKSEVCYVTWIEDDILMNPAEFWTNMQNPQYLNGYFSRLSETYLAVLPVIPTPLHEQENGKYGEYLDGPKDYLCEGAETYWIEKVDTQIPDEEIEAFMALVEQIKEDLKALAASADTDGEQQQEDYNGGMPALGGDGEEFPWGGDEGWMPPMGGHGGRGWPMDGQEGWPMGDGYGHQDGRHHGGDGHHGGAGHHGGGGHHGMRKRRGAGRALNKIKNNMNKGGKDVEQAENVIREIGKDFKVNELTIIPAGIAKKISAVTQKNGGKIYTRV